jgi:hypothetical protein
VACVRDHEQHRTTRTGQRGRHEGHEGKDKRERRGCSSESMRARCGVWREDKVGEVRSGRRENPELASARCSTKSRLPGHGRGRTIETVQGSKRTQEGSRVIRGG